MYNVVKYDDSNFHGLIDFNKSIYPHRDKIEESILFRFYLNPFSTTEKSIYIATGENNEIVGQILMMPSAIFVHGKRVRVNWGCDYKVKEMHRGSVSTALALKVRKEENVFGLGLSKRSLNIFRTLGFLSIGKLTKFIYFNKFRFLLSFFCKRHKYKCVSFPKTVTCLGANFKKINEIPDNIGFKPWNDSLYEFVRNQDFLNWRFKNFGDKYAIYVLDELNCEGSNPTFFILRHVYWKKRNCLLLVDYRLNLKCEDNFKLILKATKKIMRITKTDAIITGSSILLFDSILKSEWFHKFGIPAEIISLIATDDLRDKSTCLEVFATFADSDVDFYYGDKTW